MMDTHDNLLITAVRERDISYVNSPTICAAKRQIVDPLIVAPTQEVIDNSNALGISRLELAMNINRENRKSQSAANEKLDSDLAIASALLERMFPLSCNARMELKEAKRQHIGAEAQYRAQKEILKSNYAPSDTFDAEDLRTKLSNHTDKGVSTIDFLRQYNRYVARLKTMNACPDDTWLAEALCRNVYNPRFLDDRDRLLKSIRKKDNSYPLPVFLKDIALIAAADPSCDQWGINSSIQVRARATRSISDILAAGNFTTTESLRAEGRLNQRLDREPNYLDNLSCYTCGRKGHGSRNCKHTDCSRCGATFPIRAPRTPYPHDARRCTIEASKSTHESNGVSMNRQPSHKIQRVKASRSVKVPKPIHKVRRNDKSKGSNFYGPQDHST
jgi:hypothetical protein